MLEQRIEELTAAVKELTFALAKSGNFDVPNMNKWHGTNAQLEETRGGLTHEEYQNARLPKASEAPNAKSEETPQTTSPTSEPTESESAPVTYDDVKKVTIAVSKISKDKAVEGLAHFGVTSAKQLIESQWFTYVAHMTAILGE